MSQTCSQCGDVESHGCLSPGACPFASHLARALEFIQQAPWNELMGLYEPPKYTQNARVYVMHMLTKTTPQVHRKHLTDLQNGDYNWVTDLDLLDIGIKPLLPEWKDIAGL
jgi:hypothetical protein